MDLREDPPSAGQPFEFKLFGNLHNDKNGFIYAKWHSSQEGPPTRRLHPDDFEIINRDFCILRSPRNVSWQSEESQKNLQMDIFHTDEVKIPKHEKIPRNMEAKTLWTTEQKYLAQWYLRDLTRVNVDKILKRHFGLSMSLAGNTFADQWNPGCVIYNVEVSPNVWENRLALFFDGNIENSVQSFRFRLGPYCGDQVINTKMLGEKYMEIWRSRWGHSTADKLHPIAMRDQETRLLGLRKPRQNATAKTAVAIAQVLRGRLKKRQRRRNQAQQKLLETSDRSEEGSIDDPGDWTTNTPGSRPMCLEQIPEDDSRWRYNSGEPDIKNRNSDSPVKMTIEFPTQDPERRADGGFNPVQPQGPSWTPRIIISHLGGNDPVAMTPRRWHIMSYCRRSGEGSILKSSNTSLTSEHCDDSARLEGSHNTSSGISQLFDVHVADLLDETGFVGLGDWAPQSYVPTHKVNQSKSFISVIEADPSISVPAVQGQSLLSRVERDGYWHKFAILVGGIYSPFRELPYSFGYGIQHNVPQIVCKKGWWGRLDVDNVQFGSEMPRWRASWKFEVGTLWRP
jgi:hypothetical protein